MTKSFPPSSVVLTVHFGFGNVANEANGTEVLEHIRKAGMKVGLALKPKTELSVALPYLNAGLVDMLLVMTVEPGFGGQSFMEDMMPKVKEARKLFPSLDIQVDGGLAPATIDTAAAAGANVIVAGSAVYGAKDPKGVIDYLRESVVKHQQEAASIAAH